MIFLCWSASPCCIQIQYTRCILHMLIACSLFSCYSYKCFCPAPISFTDDWWVIHSLAISGNNLCLPSYPPVPVLIYTACCALFQGPCYHVKHLLLCAASIYARVINTLFYTEKLLATTIYVKIMFITNEAWPPAKEKKCCFS